MHFVRERNPANPRVTKGQGPILQCLIREWWIHSGCQSWRSLARELSVKWLGLWPFVSIPSWLTVLTLITLSLSIRNISVLFLQGLLSAHEEYRGHVARCGEAETQRHLGRTFSVLGSVCVLQDKVCGWSIKRPFWYSRFCSSSRAADTQFYSSGVHFSHPQSPVKTRFLFLGIHSLVGTQSWAHDWPSGQADGSHKGGFCTGFGEAAQRWWTSWVY